MRIIVSVLVVKDGKILMTQEKKEKVRGLWNFPGGNLDSDEYIFDAAVREMKEETGYDVKLGSLVGVFSASIDCQFIYFTGEVSGDMKIDPAEVLDVKWIPLDELANYPMRMTSEIMDIALSRVKNHDLHPLEVVYSLKNVKELK